MTSKHQPKVELSQSVADAVDAGTDLPLKVRVSCPSGCDLRGGSVQVLGPDGIVVKGELVTFDDEANETDVLSAAVPSSIGEHVWNISLPEQETENAAHREASFTLTLATRPHSTSMAIWDTDSPVVMGTPFSARVGVKCSSGCPMMGRVIEVRDEDGKKTGHGTLGETPWPDTDALYATEVGLVAPTTEGMFSWSASVIPTGLEIPHSKASATFSFRAVRPPEHSVTVKVISKDDGAPLENVDVRLGAYRASTDQSGLATLELPKGSYDLYVSKMGYEARAETVEVAEDVTVQVEALTAPDPESDDERLWM